MKLYSSFISPFGRKCMILARLHGLDVDEQDVSADGANGYTGGINPVGKIPALVRPDSPYVMGESHIICEYFDTITTRPKLLPNRGEARWTQMRYHALGNSIADCAYEIRYETVRPQELHWEHIIARQETALRTIVGALEREADALAAIE